MGSSDIALYLWLGFIIGSIIAISAIIYLGENWDKIMSKFIENLNKIKAKQLKKKVDWYIVWQYVLLWSVVGVIVLIIYKSNF